MSEQDGDGNAKKAKLLYTHSRDDVYALAIPDFSLAFHKSQLGNTLCFDNPKEDRFLVSALGKLQKQEKQVVSTWFHHQREFFIKQVFDKDLNPYTAFQRSKSMTDLRPSTRRKNASDVDKNRITENKSHLPNINSETNHNEVKQGGKNSGENGIQYRTPSSLSDSKRNTSEKLPIIARDNKATGVAFVTHLPTKSDKLPPISSSYLNKVNSNFRRSDRPEAVSQKIDLQSSTEFGANENSLQTNEAMTSSLPILSRSYTTLDGAQQRKKKNQTKDARHSGELKLINKLSQTLPAHLLRKAEEKIRVITNTEAIYRNKQRLLEQHKSLLQNNALSDPRWKKLESSLSENKESSVRNTSSGNSWERTLPAIRNAHNKYY